MAAVSSIEMRPIGWVRGGRAEPIDDDWGAIEAPAPTGSA
jgi:hypothetical protein